MHNLCLISIIFFQEIRFVFNKYLDCNRALCDTNSAGGHNLMFSNGKLGSFFFSLPKLPSVLLTYTIVSEKLPATDKAIPTKTGL